MASIHRTDAPGDKVVDTVDNFRSSGDSSHKVPSNAAKRPSTPASAHNPVHSPGDGEGDTARRGADLARDALAAAREATAAKRQEQTAEGRGARPRGFGRGRRRRWSGPGPDNRDPQPFGRAVSRVAMDRGWSNRLTDATVLGRWNSLVGPDIADHCTPVSLRDGELVLQAESTAWATQLRTLQRQLLQRLAAAVGPDVVRRIRVTGPQGPSWRHGPRHVRGRGPRDTYG
jgi:predicted nucleic acid-binding Zn ribbon protein